MTTVHTAKVTCPNGQIVFTAALLFLKHALSLEILGMTRRGESAYSQTKRLFLIKGTKQKVYDQLVTILTDNNILVKK